MNNFTTEEFDCLWEKATNLSIVGAIFVATGTGILIYAYIRENFFFRPGDLSMIVTIPAGVILDLVGITIWTTGAQRRNQLRNTTYYKNLNLESLNISPSFGYSQFNNTHHIGMSISLSF